jgi:hypothetical protein
MIHFTQFTLSVPVAVPSPTKLFVRSQIHVERVRASSREVFVLRTSSSPSHMPGSAPVTSVRFPRSSTALATRRVAMASSRRHRDAPTGRPATCHADTGRSATCHAPTGRSATCNAHTGRPANCHAPTENPATCQPLLRV